MGAVVIESPATCYTVRNGWAWAHLYVQHGEATQHDGRPRHWVNLSVISDYGEFGHCWTHIGSDWRAFLADLDRDYAMGKLMGPRYRVRLTGSEAADKARPLVLDMRRTDQLNKAEARELWDAINVADTDFDAYVFLRDWDGRAGGLVYRQELWQERWDQVNPQALGFWDEIWPHFIAAITPPATPTLSGPQRSEGKEEGSSRNQPSADAQERSHQSQQSDGGRD